MRYIRYTSLAVLLLAVMVWSTGCTKRGKTGTNTTHTTSQAVSSTEENVDGVKFTGVISDIEEQNSLLSVTDVNSGWVYKVAYTPTTVLLSRFGEPLSIGQLEIGELIDIIWDDTKTNAKTIQISYDAWEYEDVMGLVYDQSKNSITVRGKNFVYQNSLVLYDKTRELDGDESGATKQGEIKGQNVASAEGESITDEEKQLTASADAALTPGKRNAITLQEITSQDTVTCRGYKGKICSVVVNKGHGYIRLSNYSTYIGGTVAVGGVIEPVVKDMVLTVPVGKWTLEIDKDGKMGTKDIVVSQNQDQTVNLASLTIIAARRGIMQFRVTPEDCVITIDGREYRGQTRFVLEYGKHRVSVSAVDYKAYNGTITVSSAYMNVNVELKAISEDKEAEVNTSTTQEKTTAAITTQAATTTENVTTELTTEAAN